MVEAYRMHLRIERLENHQYLATSETVPGLVAQGRTVTETVEIAQDVARKLIESCLDHGDPVPDGLRAIDADVVELDVAVGT